MSFRDNASFGKRMEYYLIGQMLKEALGCNVPKVGVSVIKEMRLY